MVDPIASEFPILVVEDDTVSQMSLCYLLRKLGYRDYEVVESVEEALAAVQMQAYGAIFLSVDIGRSRGLTDRGLAASVCSASAAPVILVDNDGSLNGSAGRIGRHVSVLSRPYRMETMEEALDRARNLQVDINLLPEGDIHRLLDQVFDSIQVGVCVISESGRFIRINRTYSELFGYSEAELLGQPFTRVLPHYLHAHAEELHERFLRGEGSDSSLEWQVMCKDGGIRETVVKSTRFESRDGQSYKITTLTDVTGSRSRERELEQALRFKEQGLKNAHDEVKDSLALVSRLLKTVTDGAEATGARQKVVVESACRVRAIELLYDVLYRHEEQVIVSANNYIRLLAANLQTVLKDELANAKIELELADVELDVTRARSLGLFFNEAMMNVAYHAFPSDFVGQVTVRLTADSKRVHLSVTDNGEGLPEDFVPEQAATPGFTLMKDWATQLKGDLYVEGISGTRLSLTFPRSSKPAAV